MIEVKNITKSYGKKDNSLVVLKGLNFIIPDGISVAIIGKSGSGKSTLMHIMSGLDKPDSGQVIIDGKNIFKLKQKEIDSFRATKMSFIFQSFFVEGNETCYSNVSLPLEIAKITLPKRSKLIKQALTKVDLIDKEKALACDLSGGQKQRLATARAIVNSPQILFADEPTGNLDSVTGKIVEDLLFNYNKQNHTTLIIVTHDQDLAKRCDMQIHIKDGEIEHIERSKK